MRGENGQRYFTVADKITKAMRGGAVTADDIAVAFAVLELWRETYCPDCIEVTRRGLARTLGMKAQKVSGILKKLSDAGIFSLSKTRPTGGSVIEMLCPKQALVMPKSGITQKAVMPKTDISYAQNRHNTTIYNNTNTNIYIERLEKFMMFFAQHAPYVSTILTEPPTEAELEDLLRYTRRDLADAMESLEADPGYVANKRNAYRWIKNKLNYLERKPSRK